MSLPKTPNRRTPQFFNSIYQSLEINGKIYNLIFTAGKYPQGEYSRDYVKKVAAAYNVSVHQAPLFVGHRNFMNQDPAAVAWIDEVIAVENNLYAHFAEVSDSAKSLIESKAYKKCSVEIGDLHSNDGASSTPYLFAVALTNTPQVNSLPDLQFSQSNHITRPHADFLNVACFSLDNYSKSQKNNSIMPKIKDYFLSFCRQFSIAPECLPSFENDDADLTKFFSAVSDKLASKDAEIKKLQSDKAGLLVEFAVASGKVLPKDLDAYKLLAASDPAKFHDSLKAMPVLPAAKQDEVDKSKTAAGSDPKDKFSKPDGSPYTYEDYMSDLKCNRITFDKFTAEEVAELRSNWKHAKV